MTKLHEREPKEGDKFRLENDEIVTCAALLSETSGARQRLITTDSEGRIMAYSYPSGQYYLSSTSDYDIDCYVEGPKPIKAWVNIYPRAFSRAYVSKDYADKEAGSDRIACKEIEITYTPGEGLS